MALKTKSPKLTGTEIKARRVKAEAAAAYGAPEKALIAGMTTEVLMVQVYDLLLVGDLDEAKARISMPLCSEHHLPGSKSMYYTAEDILVSLIDMSYANKIKSKPGPASPPIFPGACRRPGFVLPPRLSASLWACRNR